MSLKQRIQAVVDDDRGVSPVIGVILMVAITVILAAVIGTFVLGLGDSLEQAPQAQLNAESGSPDNITISHNGGDALTVSELTINVNGDDQTDNFTTANQITVGDSVTNNVTANASVTAGDTATVTVIHNPSESILFEQEVDVQD